MNRFAIDHIVQQRIDARRRAAEQHRQLVTGPATRAQRRTGRSRPAPRARIAAAVLGGAFAMTSGLVATSATAGSEPRPEPSTDRRQAEPAQHAIPDGTYLGYIRDAASGDAIVDVDFVASRDGTIINNRPALNVDANLIARLDPLVGLFGPNWRPFRIAIADDEIVAVQTADDLLAPADRDNTRRNVEHALPPARGDAR